MSQCKSVTKGGTRCQRKALPGRRYCWQHESKLLQGITLGGSVVAVLALIGLLADLAGLGFPIPNLTSTRSLIPMPTSTPAVILAIEEESLDAISKLGAGMGMWRFFVMVGTPPTDAVREAITEKIIVDAEQLGLPLQAKELNIDDHQEVEALVERVADEVHSIAGSSGRGLFEIRYYCMWTEFLLITGIECEEDMADALIVIAAGMMHNAAAAAEDYGLEGYIASTGKSISSDILHDLKEICTQEEKERLARVVMQWERQAEEAMRQATQ